MKIKPAAATDLDAVLCVHRDAFGSQEESSLVEALLSDASAQPCLSLLALRQARAVGHILFSRATVGGAPELSASILAPLAVVPEAQKQGIGGELIRQGLQLLSKSGVDLVFVLGYPAYYPRHGFRPAEALGFKAPYPIAPENSDAWMVQALRPGVIGAYSGVVVCADALDHPAYWAE
ncbi:MAG: N-acetyltransferase [Desulfobacterales bacterium]|nr:N-acetyltransferase [Desulfobacterales bacterium]